MCHISKTAGTILTKLTIYYMCMAMSVTGNPVPTYADKC